MNHFFHATGQSPYDLAPLWEDGERLLCRGIDTDNVTTVMVVVAGYSSSASFDRLTHEFSLKDVLDSDWAVRPIRLERDSSGAALVLEDPGGEPLAKLLDSAMEIDRFLRLAIGITQTLGKLHRSGLVHRDIKPANIMAGCADGRVRLTGFGLASQLPRERQTPGPPDTIAGTLAYIAPEQTGRMNRSIDARSDLYALGITFYQMLTGVLPFTASNPMGWCIAISHECPSHHMNARRASQPLYH
ncbi:serine/threonine protein kinase [Bradyrhizobium symbiodeficiens]|uniref:serine/threonine protein kinase n=1 Tax=Bradyrhizobium symbiodeficiens TaxID=1404367 RepID=UPI002FE5A026